MTAEKHSGFSSSFGVIMAAAGSAVGLGNIWRFPYICGKYGGGAFLLVYVFFVFLIGMALMMSEFIIGRRSRHSPMKAYPALSGGHRGWMTIGVVVILTCVLILAVYLIISGWTLSYFVYSITGKLSTIDDSAFASYFDTFAASPTRPTAALLVFLFLTMLVIISGVRKGIEKVSKIMMPILVVELLILCVRSLTLDGASAGLHYLFHPDFSLLGWEGVLAALGQALFSLTVGFGTMVVYGSYIPHDDNMLKTSLWITACDFLIAVLAGVAIFPAVFACGQDPAGGPGLVYQVLPAVFNSMGNLGSVFSSMFFLLLTLAALTSAISLLETLTATAVDYGYKRTRSTIIISIFEAVLAVATCLTFSGGIWSGARLGGRTLYEWLDMLTGAYLPPIGVLLTAIFLGWVMKKDDIRDELSNHGSLPVRYFNVFYSFLMKFVAPLSVLFVLVSGIIG